MISDVLSYALLMGVFVITALRRWIEKPNNITELPLLRGRKNPSKTQDQSR